MEDFKHLDMCWKGNMARQDRLAIHMKAEESLVCSDKVSDKWQV